MSLNRRRRSSIAPRGGAGRKQIRRTAAALRRCCTQTGLTFYNLENWFPCLRDCCCRDVRLNRIYFLVTCGFACIYRLYSEWRRHSVPSRRAQLLMNKLLRREGAGGGITPAAARQLCRVRFFFYFYFFAFPR